MATWKKSHPPTFLSGGSLVQVVRGHAVTLQYQPETPLRARLRFTGRCVGPVRGNAMTRPALVPTPGHVDLQFCFLQIREFLPTLTRHQIVHPTLWTLTLQVPSGRCRQVLAIGTRGQTR